MNFVWTNDMDATSLGKLNQAFASQSPAFVEYLATLGMRTREGKNKKGFLAFREEAANRGWVK